MLKIKDITKYIIILFVVYFIISVCINISSVYTNMSSTENMNIIKEQIGNNSKDWVLLAGIIGASIFGTILSNIEIIIIFIVVILVDRKYRKGKMNKDDFEKTKHYYREILEQNRNMRNIMDR